MQIVMVILVVILTFGQVTQPSQAADSAFIPVPGRPLVNLVVKPCRPESVGKIQDPAQVKVDARKAAWGFDPMAILLCSYGCANNRYITIAIRHGQQRIGFFHTRGHDTTWPGVFKTPV